MEEEKKDVVDSTNTGNEDYYSLLQQENYKSLLNKEVQMANAKDQALKYVNNNLSASGLGTQGMSESARVGIMNNYGANRTQALSDYGTQNNEIELQRLEANKTQDKDNFESLTTLMSNATSGEDLSKVLTGYGLTVDANGKLGGDYFNAMNPEYQKQLQVYYDMTNGQFVSEDNAIQQSIAGKTSFNNNYDSLRDIVLEDGTKASVNTEHEIKYITNNKDFLDNLTNGKVVCIQHGSRTGSKAYLQFYNGKWYQVDATTYYNSNNKELIKGK